MVRADRCWHVEKKVETTITKALALRDTARRQHKPDPTYLCISCRATVYAHKKGGEQGAHFEHKFEDENCRLSRAWRASGE